MDEVKSVVPKKAVDGVLTVTPNRFLFAGQAKRL